MRLLKWKEIAEQIKDDNEINFIGRVLTPLHVLGIETLLLYLKEKGVKCKGYILIVPHYETGLGVNDDILHPDMYEGVEPVLLDEKNEPKQDAATLLKLNQRNENEQVFYFANPFRAELGYVAAISKLRPDSNLRVIITEEGNGNYLRNPYKLSRMELVGMSFKEGLRYFVEACIRDRFFVSRMTRNGFVSDFTMLMRENGEGVKNEDYVRNIVKILKTKVSDDNFSEYEDAIVICPSLLYESGYLKIAQDLDIYADIQRALGDGKYLVKPHPREKDKQRYSVLNCNIDERHTLSTEELLARLSKRPKCIIGDSSTVLVSASALFGVKTVSINQLFDRKILTDKHYFDGFNNSFGQMCYIPKSLEELVDYIKREIYA